MNKGLIILMGIAVAAIVVSGTLAAQVYKVVDENGNVTYTDQPPEDGSAPMDLPEISVVESQYPSEMPNSGGAENQASNSADAKTPRELRQLYSDFRLLSPTPEENYWGTGNTVVVSWGTSSAYEPGMSVSVVVDGTAQDADPNSNLPVTLDRGEHQVYAVLRDVRGRRIVTSEIVTFTVHQASRRNNPG